MGTIRPRIPLRSCSGSFHVAATCLGANGVTTRDFFLTCQKKKTASLFIVSRKFVPDKSGGGGGGQNCSDIDTTFPTVFDNKQCQGLKQATSASDLKSCQAACCAQASCEIYQWCPASSNSSEDGAENASCGPAGSCWIGQLGGAGGPGACTDSKGWISRGRSGSGPSPPSPGGGGKCTDPRCDPKTDDSKWRVVNVPHDFVVEGNFSETFDASQGGLSMVPLKEGGLGTTDPKVHGYLPFGIAWYVTNSPHPLRFFANSRTLMGCTDPLRREVGAPHPCPPESVTCHCMLTCGCTSR